MNSEATTVARTCWRTSFNKLRRQDRRERLFRACAEWWPAVVLSTIMLVTLGWQQSLISNIGLQVFSLLIWGGLIGYSYRAKAETDYELWVRWGQSHGKSEDLANAWWFLQQHEIRPLEWHHIQQQTAWLTQQTVQWAERRFSGKTLILGFTFCLFLWGLMFLGHPSFHQPSESFSSLMQYKAQAKVLDPMLELIDETLSDIGEHEVLQALQDRGLALQFEAEKTSAQQADQALKQLEEWLQEAKQTLRQLKADELAISPTLLAAMLRITDTQELAQAIQLENWGQAATETEFLAQKLTRVSDVKSSWLSVFMELQQHADDEEERFWIGKSIVLTSHHVANDLWLDASRELDQLAQLMRQRVHHFQQFAAIEFQLQEQAVNQSNQQNASSAVDGVTDTNDDVMSSTADLELTEAPIFEIDSQQIKELLKKVPQQITESVDMTQSEEEFALLVDTENAEDATGESTVKLMVPIPTQATGNTPQAWLNDAAKGLTAGGMPTDLNLLESAGDSKTRVTEDVEVAAQRGAQGESRLQSVESMGGSTAPQSETVESVIAWAEAQEKAVTERAIPMDRREMLRRYFQMLRAQLERSDG